MKIKFTNFGRVVDIGALSGASDSIIVILFLIVLFAGLAYFFKAQFGIAVLFVILTFACVYALINEIIGILPIKKDK